MSGLAIMLFGAGLVVCAGLVKIADALREIAKELSTINTHGLHLQNYPGKSISIKQEQPQ